MPPVSPLLLKLSHKLFATSTLEQAAFLQTLTDPQPYPPCILWLQPRPSKIPFAVEAPLSWQVDCVDRLAIDTAAGAHSLHQTGHYYCLDFSSVFAASVLQALPERPSVVLDLCAAPGGKSLFAWRLLQPDSLICNETINKRVGMLIGNLKRCGVKPVIVLSNDPSHLALRLPQTANLVMVDAPCSGQSLLAKGEQAAGCFHPVTIKKNAQRQKRILACAAQLVASQGFLAYMTCTFSTEENEQVGQWFSRKFPQFEPWSVPHLAAYQSHLSEMPCYRLWPQAHIGAGAFTMLFRNTAVGQTQPPPTKQWPGWRWASAPSEVESELP
jgi:16S rRNA C967 or C1407 C5-methylase (RsmB/RsmF family)